jgi:gliding motility-associated lipoprotein GldH
LSLTIDHQLQYAHQNIYLRLKTRFPNGQRTTDVQSLDFYNSTGQSTGDCSGGNCQVTFDLQKNARFRLPGDYSLTVEQWMRRDSVTGIKNITLAVKKSKP